MGRVLAASFAAWNYFSIEMLGSDDAMSQEVGAKGQGWLAAPTAVCVQSAYCSTTMPPVYSQDECLRSAKGLTLNGVPGDKHCSVKVQNCFHRFKLIQKQHVSRVLRTAVVAMIVRIDR